MSIPLPALPRPENKGTATGVDAICTYHPNTSNQQLNREHLYWELKRLNDGIMQLGPYTLDQNSLYVNGELYFRVILLSPNTTAFSIPSHFHSFFIIYVGYTQHILATTHRSKYPESPLFVSKPMSVNPYPMLVTHLHLAMNGEGVTSLYLLMHGVSSQNT